MDWETLVALLLLAHRPGGIPDPPPDARNALAAVTIERLSILLENREIGQQIGKLAGSALR